MFPTWLWVCVCVCVWVYVCVWRLTWYATLWMVSRQQERVSFCTASEWMAALVWFWHATHEQSGSIGVKSVEYSFRLRSTCPHGTSATPNLCKKEEKRMNTLATMVPGVCLTYSCSCWKDTVIHIHSQSWTHYQVHRESMKTKKMLIISAYQFLNEQGLTQHPWRILACSWEGGQCKVWQFSRTCLSPPHHSVHQQHSPAGLAPPLL